MRLFSHPKFLPVYSGVLTLAVVVALLSGFARVPGDARFGSIDVQRIRVVEPDGTLRMIIANHAHQPGIIEKGKEYPHPSRAAGDSAGIIFYDAEGSESGGLTFGGKREKDGTVSRYGHLSFDQYGQDEMMALNAMQEGDRRKSGLLIKDEPDWPLLDLVKQMQAHAGDSPKAQNKRAMDYMAAHGRMHVPRAWIGRNDDDSSSMELKDAKGRPRLVAEVGADGTPTIRFLAANGKVTGEWPESARRPQAASENSGGVAK